MTDNNGQPGGGRGGDGGNRAAQQQQRGGQRQNDKKIKHLAPLQWIGIIGVHSHLFDDQCKGSQLRWRTMAAVADGLPALCSLTMTSR